MSNSKKIIISIIAGVMSLILIFGVWWLAANWNNLMAYVNGSKLYRWEELKQANEEGYKAGFTDKQNIDTQIENYREQISALTLQKNTLNAQIVSLNSQIATLSQYGETYDTEITNLQQRLVVLNDTRLQLESLIGYLQMFVDAYENKDNFIVAFYVENKIYNTQIIVPNDFANEPTAPNKDFEFLGWSLNGIDVVDVTTYEIIDNTVFYALFKYGYDVIFMVDDAVYDTQFINVGKNAELPPQPNYDIGFNHIGWSVNGVIVDVANYEIKTQTTFVAVFEYNPIVWSGSIVFVNTTNFNSSITSASLDLSTLGLDLTDKTIQITIKQRRFVNSSNGALETYSYTLSSNWLVNFDMSSVGAGQDRIRKNGNVIEFGFSRSGVIITSFMSYFEITQIKLV